jgi:hypothetical protein
MLPKPGKHWPTDEQGNSVLPVSHNVRCVEHPLNVHPCSECAAKKCPPDPKRHADYLAEKKKLEDRKTAARAVARKLADFDTSKETQ